MRIGVDARLLMDPAGTGMRSFLYHLLEELWRTDQNNEYFLYATGPLHLPFDPESSPRWHVRIGRGWPAKINILWMQTSLNLLVRRDRLNVFLGTRHVLPYFLRLFAPDVRRVSIIFDIFAVTTPRVTPFKTWFYNISNTVLSCRLADVLVATSESTRRDLVRTLKIDPQKIHVVYGAANEAIFYPRPGASRDLDEKYGIKKPFILSGDVHNPRKNFSTVLRTYARLPDHLKNSHDLVGTGAPATFYSAYSVEEDVKALGLEDHVRLVGLIDHLDMPLFYSAAALFAFPSLYEGFGLPILEAMSCGCPVITSNVSSMPEAGGDSAFYVDPENPKELRKHMTSLLTDINLNREMSSKGLANAERFSWEAYAKKVLKTCALACESNG